MSAKCWGNFQPSVQQFDSVGYTGLPAVHTRYRLKFDRACKPLEIERCLIERSKGQSRVYRPLPELTAMTPTLQGIVGGGQ